MPAERGDGTGAGPAPVRIDGGRGPAWATLVGGVLLATSIFFWIETFDEAYDVSAVSAGRGPMFYPRILLAAWTLLALVVTLRGLREPPIGPVRWRPSLTVAGAMAVTALYVVGILHAGFLIATAALAFVLPLVLGYRNLIVLILFASLFPVVTWWLFDKVFKIILPTSPWFDSF